MKIYSVETNFLKLNFPNENSLYDKSANLTKSYFFLALTTITTI